MRVLSISVHVFLEEVDVEPRKGQPEDEVLALSNREHTFGCSIVATTMEREWRGGEQEQTRRMSWWILFVGNQLIAGNAHWRPDN